MSNNKKIKKIITHPGTFHADDVFAVAWLRESGLYVDVERKVPSSEELEDPEIIVLDIGGEFRKDQNNYDHHQREGAGVRDNNVPFAAFGLISSHWPLENELVQDKVDQRLVQPVDAGDCGWGTLEGTRPIMTVSALISGFNPTKIGATNGERDAAFRIAVEFARHFILNEIDAARRWAEVKEEVMSAPTPIMGVMVLDKFVPWTEHIFSKPDQEGLLYVVFPSERGGWMIQQVPKTAGSFEGRKPLPKEWAGLRGEEFAKVACLAEWGNATFCHSGRFVAGAETKELALQLAKAAIAS